MVNDAPATNWKWCRSCRKNVEFGPQGKQHLYSKGHQQTLLDFLTKQCEKIAKVRTFLQNVVNNSNQSTDEETFWCFCCELEVDNTSCNFVHFLSLKHLVSKQHQKKLDEFWNETAAYLIKDKLNKTKAKFAVSQHEYREFLKEVKWQDSQMKSGIQHDNSLNNNSITNLSSSITHIAPSASTSDITEETRMVVNKQYRTVFSSHGIAQNPTGFHNGKRVWGGGIIKYKDPEDWLPWPIDLDEESESLSQDTQKQASTTGVITATAFGSNLTSLGPHTLAPGEGNIHTGALPPWLLQNTNTSVSLKSIRLPKFNTNPRKSNSKKPERLGADHAKAVLLARARAKLEGKGDITVKPSADYLPNFGPVWQSGSRAESREAFRQEDDDQQHPSNAPSLPVTSTAAILSSLGIHQAVEDIEADQLFATKYTVQPSGTVRSLFK